MSEFRYERDMRGPVIEWLEAQGFLWTRELCSLSYNQMDIVAGRFAPRSSRRIPVLLEAVSIELKLHNVRGVLSQARNNRGSVERCFAALPQSKCQRLKPSTVEAFRADGVGLLAVAVDGVRVILPARPSDTGTHDRIYKNLWRKLRKESVVVE